MYVFWFDPSNPENLQVYDSSFPLLSVMDEAVNRANGVFETLGVFAGKILNLKSHLERMQRSASSLGFEPIDFGCWRKLLLEAAKRLAPYQQGALKAVYARGVAGDMRAWIVGFPVTDCNARRQGISVVTLGRGIQSDVGHKYPWLLYGAKTLAYAVNMAALEQARRRGADDAIFFSEDGLLLEGTTSNLVVYDGERFITPCTKRMSILVGTTQKKLFELLVRQGRKTAEGLLPLKQLDSFSGVWLVSSVRMVTPVSVVDGKSVRVDYGLSEWLNQIIIKDAGND